MKQNDSARAAPAELLKVTRIIPGATFPNVTLELENGTALPLLEGARASLSPLQPEGLSVLAYQWGRPDAAVYAVPAALYAELLPYFPHGGQE